MSKLFAQILKQASITFDRQNVASFKANFTLLKQYVDQMTIKDLNLDQKLVSENTFKRPDKAPCTFVDIFQNNDIAMSVFILQNGYTMPLHDHPMMYGILKSLHGKVLVQSYTQEVVPITSSNQDEHEVNSKYTANQINVTAEQPKLVTSDTECAILTPLDRNFHEITAIDGVSAFFDILSPPYESNIPIYGPRKCSFYQKIILKENTEKQHLTLQKINAPTSYYCDTSQYNQPDFLLEYYL